MDSLRRYARIIACTLVGLLPVAAADAQTADLAVIEGYVFNSETLKPLVGARIAIEVSFAEGGGHSRPAITDSNGFYTVAIEASDTISALQGIVGCYASRGRLTRTVFPLYVPVKPTVYQRNVYLKPPGSVTRCR